jgi:Selenocysteine lyase
LDAAPLKLEQDNSGITNGQFHACTRLQGLGIEPNDGVVRVSMVHYNSIEEVRKLIGFLDKTI